MLYLDREAPVIGKSPGTTRGLNIRTPLYVGGVNQDKFTISTNLKVGSIIKLVFFLLISKKII